MFLFPGVVPEYQCAIKRETKKAQKDKDKPNSTTRDSGSDDKEEKPLSPPTNNGGQPRALSKAQEELISKLVVYQEEYESPSEDDFKKITVSLLSLETDTNRNDVAVYLP